MNMITSTELRTKTPQLIEALVAGYSIDLVHRSRVVGEIKPKDKSAKLFNAKRIEKIVSELNLPNLSDREIDRRYRQHIMKKYGKGLSRHK